MKNRFDSINFVLKNYDMETISTHQLIHPPYDLLHLRIDVVLLFKPKQINAMTPKVCVMRGSWAAPYNNVGVEMNGLDIISVKEMPLLTYTSTYNEFTSFCMNLTKSKANEIAEKLRDDPEVWVYEEYD